MNKENYSCPNCESEIKSIKEEGVIVCNNCNELIILDLLDRKV